MKKLLGLVGSYRKQGNGEIMTKAVARKLGPDWELSLIRLPKLNIKPCKGCYVCLLPGKACNIEDDVEWLFERIEETDAVLFTAPNYILGPVGIVKMLTDRALQAAAHANSFKAKRTVVALTMGKEDFRGYADAALASQVGGLGLKVGGLEIFYGTHPGEVALAEEFDEKVQRLVDALLAPEGLTEDRPQRCPCCRSDLFRVRPEGLECAMCKSMAILEQGVLKFTKFHPQFTDEGRQEHREWLIEKKLEFNHIKDRLREIREAYPEGVWLSPSAE